MRERERERERKRDFFGMIKRGKKSIGQKLFA